MPKLLRCEFRKLKRLPFLRVTTVLSVLFPCLLTAYVSQQGSGFSLLYRFVFLYGDLLFRPFVLGILGLILLTTERDHDTMKALRTVPVSGGALFGAKLSALLVLSFVFSATQYLATAVGGLLLGGEMDLSLPIRTSLAMGLFGFLDILPLTAFFCVKGDGKVFSVIVTLFYSVAGFLLANAYASGMAEGIFSVFPRILILRWFLGFFSLADGISSMMPISTMKAMLSLLSIGAVSVLVTSLLYGRKEGNV